MINKRFETEKLIWVKIEDAFQRIKNQSGQISVEEVVESFLTKEKKFCELMNSVKEKEHRLEGFKSKLEEIQSDIDLIQLKSGEREDGCGDWREMVSSKYSQINDSLLRLASVRGVHTKTIDWLR